MGWILVGEDDGVGRKEIYTEQVQLKGRQTLDNSTMYAQVKKKIQDTKEDICNIRESLKRSPDIHKAYFYAGMNDVVNLLLEFIEDMEKREG